MKLTESRLRQLVKEEITFLNEEKLTVEAIRAALKDMKSEKDLEKLFAWIWNSQKDHEWSKIWMYGADNKAKKALFTSIKKNIDKDHTLF